MIRTFAFALAAATIALAPVAASAAIPPGTELTGSISQAIGSKDAQVGQPFTIQNAHSANYDINGAVIYGHVSSIQRAGQGTPGKINLAIDKVNTRSGNIYQVSGYVSNVTENTKSNATKEAAAGAGGALLGMLVGGKTVGALVGGGAGYLVAKNNRQQITIPQGSLVTVTISQSRRQSSR